MATWKLVFAAWYTTAASSCQVFFFLQEIEEFDSYLAQREEGDAENMEAEELPVLAIEPAEGVSTCWSMSRSAATFKVAAFLPNSQSACYKSSPAHLPVDFLPTMTCPVCWPSCLRS